MSLRHLRSFDHPVHDRVGAMEEFGKRSNKYIKKISDEIFNKKSSEKKIKPKKLSINKKQDAIDKVLNKRKNTQPFGWD